MQAVLLDTNVIILHLANKMNLVFVDLKPNISSLTVFELLQLPGLSSKEEADITAIIRSSATIPVSDEIAVRAAKLARSHHIGAIDLLIAATAMEHGLPLISQNRKHFRKIKGLVIHSDVD